MNEDTLNMAIRKFLKKVGISSQREIEHAILKAVENGDLMGDEKLTVTMTLNMPSIGIHHEIDGKIELD